MAWAELSDCRCYYEILGEGTPLLMIPGLASTSAIWDSVAPELAQFFSVILFDNRGMGRSIARRAPTSLADYVSDIVELLDHLQVDQAHVLGVSLGGVIAQRVAIDHASRVRRLVLGSCADAFSPYLREMSLLLAHSLRRFPKEMFFRTMSLLTTAPQDMDSDEELFERDVQRRCQTKTSARAIGTQLRCLAASDLNPRHFRIASPTLVFAGEYDPIIPNCYSRRLADRIPGSQFELIHSTGHNPIVDHPERVLPMVIEFLSGPREYQEQEQGGQFGSLMPYMNGGAPFYDMVQGGDGS